MKNKKLTIPNHVGIIMDGNRRWASERNLPSFDGHAKGLKIAKNAPEWFYNYGVKIVSIYVFSTENWNRAQKEVNYLMKLIKDVLADNLEEMQEKGYKIVISGRIDELPGDLPETCLDAVAKTKDNTKGTLNICLNYGGRAEMVDAIKKMVSKNITVDQVHEGMIRKYLYQSDLPDPDLIVRTSGEQRLSGFQLWEGAYSELMFMQKYWPDFEKSDVDIIIEEYNSRKRRFGAG